MEKIEQQKLIDKIIRTVLGYSSLGFLDMDNDPGKWQEFADTYFTRSGSIQGLEYDAELNKRLSSTAMLQTIDEIRKRLEELRDRAT